MVNSIITDLLKKLINNPYTSAKIEHRLMPTLVSILNTTTAPENKSTKEQGDFATLITVRFHAIFYLTLNFNFTVYFFKSTLDLITAILRAKPQVPHSDLIMNAFFLVVNLCIKNDDTAILQVCRLFSFMICFQNNQFL